MRIEINEPQAIWEIGQQSEQQDNIYPHKGEADQADRIFIVGSGHSADGTTSKDIINNISGYFKRYRLASGEISDEDIMASLDTCRSKDGNSRPGGIAVAMLCLHREGITAVSFGGGHIFQIRPSAKRIVFESHGNEKATIASPAISHITDIEPGDIFYICSNGMLEQMDSAAICKFFSEEGSDDRKRNMLRSSTSGNKANHSAYFIDVRTIISEDGNELAARRPIVIPDIKSAKPIGKAYDEDDDDDEVVVKPEEKVEAPKPKAEPQRPQRPQQPKPHQQTKHEPRPISRYEDERKQTNTRMVILVAVIIVLAIAAGMLWYFNSSSKSTLPADTTTVESTVKDTTATPAPEPADSAIIPDSAIAEPDRATQEVAPKRHQPEHTYNTTVEEEPEEEEPATTEPTTTPSTEPEHKAEPTKPAKPATEAPASEASSSAE